MSIGRRSLCFVLHTWNMLVEGHRTLMMIISLRFQTKVYAHTPQVSVPFAFAHGIEHTHCSHVSAASLPPWRETINMT